MKYLKFVFLVNIFGKSVAYNMFVTIIMKSGIMIFESNFEIYKIGKSAHK